MSFTHKHYHIILQDSEVEAASECCSTQFDHKESENVKEEERVAASTVRAAHHNQHHLSLQAESAALQLCSEELSLFRGPQFD